MTRNLGDRIYRPGLVRVRGVPVVHPRRGQQSGRRAHRVRKLVVARIDRQLDELVAEIRGDLDRPKRGLRDLFRR